MAIPTPLFMQILQQHGMTPMTPYVPGMQNQPTGGPQIPTAQLNQVHAQAPSMAGAPTRQQSADAQSSNPMSAINMAKNGSSLWKNLGGSNLMGSSAGAGNVGSMSDLTGMTTDPLMSGKGLLGQMTGSSPGAGESWGTGHLGSMGGLGNSAPAFSDGSSMGSVGGGMSAGGGANASMAAATTPGAAPASGGAVLADGSTMGSAGGMSVGGGATAGSATTGSAAGGLLGTADTATGAGLLDGTATAAGTLGAGAELGVDGAVAGTAAAEGGAAAAEGTMAAAGAANAWNPVGWGLLGAAAIGGLGSAEGWW